MSPLDFTFCSYNVFLRPRFPIFLDGQLPRARLLPRFLSDPAFDAVALCEVFDPRAREELIARLCSVYPHRTRVLGDAEPGWTLTGGVVILSRWPIEGQAEQLFGAASEADDRLARKGVVYARVRKQGRAVHLLATHANSRSRAVMTRGRQFAIIRSFARRLRVPRDEPLLIAGDMNVDRGRRSEHEAMLAILESRLPDLRGLPHTYDPISNPLAYGRTPLFIDYVLSSRRNLAPQKATLEVQRPLGDPWRRLPLGAPQRDLSDHYPVVGRFRF